MIEFQSLDLGSKAHYDQILYSCGERGCEYSFTNLYLWGRQKAAFLEGNLVFFSQFNRRSVYPFPIGPGDRKVALDAIMHDAKVRGIPCRLTGLTQEDRQLLEQLYPDRFHFHFDRDSFDYVYSIHDLADLPGRKFQRKRNHLNKFTQLHPDFRTVPITAENLAQVQAFVEQWYVMRQQEDPHGDFHMEKVAIRKAMEHMDELDTEGLALYDGNQLMAVTMGSRLSETTFDVHFEKALDRNDGAYGAINREFARYLREKYPALLWLNREDDMGLEGLRKAKLSYNPDHMIEKQWACLLEDGYDY